MLYLQTTPLKEILIKNSMKKKLPIKNIAIIVEKTT